jgi:superoxide dismutase, Fe-Mn family
MKHELPALPYALDALEPVISKTTLEFHHGKHHQAYVNNLNNLIPGTPFEDATLDRIVIEAEGGIFNNGAQVWNHTFYWNCLAPGGRKLPGGDFANALLRDFGSMDAFMEQFAKAAVTQFGSGWAWLSAEVSGKLVITQESNAGNPMRMGLIPLLTFDVWEHAYYLDKQNRRPDYVADLWKIVDWEAVAGRYKL